MKRILILMKGLKRSKVPKSLLLPILCRSAIMTVRLYIVAIYIKNFSKIQYVISNHKI